MRISTVELGAMEGESLRRRDLLRGGERVDALVVEGEVEGWTVAPIYRSRMGTSPVAVKLIDLPAAMARIHGVGLSSAAVSDEQARLDRDIDAVLALGHRGIAPTIGFGRVGAATYLVTPWMEEVGAAMGLERVLAAQPDGALPWPRAAQLFRTALEGLAALHAAGLAHGRIAPDNLWIAVRGGGEQAIWLDVVGRRSLERMHAELARSSTRSWTRAGDESARLYWAPEHVMAPREPTCAGDVFSMAALLATMVSGQPLVEGSSAMAVLAELSRASWTVPAVIADSPWHDAWRRALARRPEDRFADAAAFLAALR